MILGPACVGKKFLLDVLFCSPFITKAGSQTAPITVRLKVADRYIVLDRRLAAASDYRRRKSWTPVHFTYGECVRLNLKGRQQVDKHVEFADVLRLQYEEVVADIDKTIDSIAEWLDIPSWSINFPVNNGDIGLE